MLVSEVERRAYKRLPIECEVVYDTGESETHGRGAGKNLSGNGILFVSDRALPLGAKLQVQIIPSIRSIAPMTALIKVVRVEAAARQYTIAGTIEKVIN
jgi:hypothetical protein